MHTNVLYSVQGPSLPAKIKKPFWVLYCQIWHSWLIASLPLWEITNNDTVITNNAKAFWNLFVSKPYISSCLLCRSSYLLFNADYIIIQDTALSITLCEITSFWWLSQRFLLCFIGDDHKCKHYPENAEECER